MFKMRYNATRGYYGYRGRRNNGKWLILALVVVILAGTLFLFAQRSRVYRSDGSTYIELPWTRSADDAAAADAPPQEGG